MATGDSMFITEKDWEALRENKTKTIIIHENSTPKVVSDSNHKFQEIARRFPLFRGIQSICCTGRVSAEIAFSDTYSLVPSVDLHKKSCAMELRVNFPNSNAYVFGRFSTNYNLGLGIGVRPENSIFLLSPILGCYVNTSREITPFYGVSWIFNLW